MINDQVHGSAVLYMGKETSSDHGVRRLDDVEKSPVVFPCQKWKPWDIKKDFKCKFL
jgi:hypothetical protein